VSKEILTVLLSLALYGITIIFFEYQYKKGWNAFTVRKLSHAGSGLISAFLPLILSKQSVFLVLIILALLVTMSKVFRIFKGIEDSKDITWGTLMFPLGLLFPLLFFWDFNKLIFSGSALILAFADSTAALVGKKYGTLKYKIFSDKTFEGSLTFAAVSTILLLIVYYIAFGTFHGLTFSKFLLIFQGPILISFVEAVSDKGTDNLFIPLTAGSVIYIMFVI
jgi:phytol kinase